MIVFDLDDTLYKERDYVASGTNHVLSLLHQRYPGLSKSEIESIKWSDEELIEYRAHFPNISLPADTAFVLNLLRARAIEMAIITDGRSIQQRNKIKALGLDKYFDDDHIVISEEIGADKTTPTPFLTLMSRFPNETSWTYVGDNPRKDFLHANKLGWHTIMVQDVDRINVHSQDIIPDLDMTYLPKTVINSLKDLENLI